MPIPEPHGQRLLLHCCCCGFPRLPQFLRGWRTPKADKCGAAATACVRQARWIGR